MSPFSASNAGSNIAELIGWLIERGTAITSDLAVAEARKSIALKRTAWLPTFAALLRMELVPAALFGLSVPLAQQDVPLLCAAIRSQCRYFATGDR